ncbi:MAG: NepR family anti-sigma factor [Yoonia sp.]
MDHSDKDQDPRVEALINQNLKLCYPDLGQDELPDRFKDLLAVLKAQDKTAKSDE